MSEKKPTKKELTYRKRLNNLVMGKILITGPVPFEKKEKQAYVMDEGWQEELNMVAREGEYDDNA